MMAYYNPQRTAWKTAVAVTLIPINLNPLKTAILSLPNKKRVLSYLVGGFTNPSEKICS